MRPLTPRHLFNSHRLGARRSKSDHKDAGQLREQSYAGDLRIRAKFMTVMFLLHQINQR